MRSWFRSGVVLALSAASSYAEAACVLGRPAERSSVEAFVSDPPSLLSRHTTGDLALAYEVQGLALATSDSLEGIFAAARRASFEQAEAIGVGLKKVASYCAARDPDLVRRIRDGVRDRTSRDVMKGFAADEWRSAPPQYGSVGDGGGSAASSLSGLSLTLDGRIGSGTPAPAPASRLSPTQALDGTDLHLLDPDRRYAPFKAD